MPTPSLLERCQRGESAAWKTLFESYVRSVYRWAVCFGLDKSSAEEITQEVFATTYRSIGKCVSEEQLPSWLFQITRRHAANHRRSTWVKSALGFAAKTGGDVDEPDANEPQASLQRELALDLQRSLRKMPIKLAEILILHDLDGMSREEISESLGIPGGTVASRLQQARKVLKELLAGVGEP